MKKIIMFFVSFMILGVSHNIAAAYINTDNIKQGTIYINNIEIRTDSTVVKKNDEVFIPFRTIFEALGSCVIWDEETGNIYFDYNGTDYICELNKGHILIHNNNVIPKNINGYIQLHPMAPSGYYYIINDYTYLYYKTTGERLLDYFGWEAVWDEDTLSLYINRLDYQLRPFEDENYMWGYRDTDCNIIVEPKYFRAGNFYEGLSLACIESDKGLTYLFINEEGEQAFPDVYYGAYSFNDGVAAVEFSEDNWGWIDTSGNRIFEQTFKKAGSFGEGYAAVLIEAQSDGTQKWSFINKQGEFVTDMLFDDAYSCFSNGYAYVKYNGQKGKIDKEFNFYPN